METSDRDMLVETIDEHIDHYFDALQQQTTLKYAMESTSMLRRMCRDLKITSWRELSSANIHSWIQSKRRSTSRTYLLKLKSFGNWMARSGRISENPFSCIPLPRNEIRFSKLRFFTIAEIQRLGDYLSNSAEPEFSMQPANRKLLYCTAVLMGLRPNELLHLRRQDLRPDKEMPMLMVRQNWSLRVRECPLPVPRKLATALVQLVRPLHPTANIFRPSRPQVLSQMLRRDLVKAKIDLLPEEKANFHSLRATAMSWWVNVHKLPMRSVLRLARLKSGSLVEHLFSEPVPDIDRYLEGTDLP